jgi:hypothetical protein
MTEQIGRRTLLTSAVLGTTATLVGATALGSLAPETAFAGARAQLPDAGQPDPNFAEGRVISRTDAMVMASGSDGRLHRIQLTGGTSVWKLRPTTLDQVQVGDGLYARGVLMGGVLAAESVWVNIVNLKVHIAAIGKNVLYLDHNGQRVVGHVLPGTSAAVYNGTPAVSDMSMLKVGNHAQVIGAWRPDTNEVDVATIYAAA